MCGNFDRTNKFIVDKSCYCESLQHTWKDSLKGPLENMRSQFIYTKQYYVDAFIRHGNGKCKVQITILYRVWQKILAFSIDGVDTIGFDLWVSHAHCSCGGNPKK